MLAPEFLIYPANAFMIEAGDFVFVKNTYQGDNCTLYVQTPYEVVTDYELSSSGHKYIDVKKGFETEQISTEFIYSYTPLAIIKYGEVKAREGYKQAIDHSLNHKY